MWASDWLILRSAAGRYGWYAHEMLLLREESTVVKTTWGAELVFLQYCPVSPFPLKSAAIYQVLLCAHHALARHP